MANLTRVSATDTALLLERFSALAHDLVTDAFNASRPFLLNAADPDVLPALFDVLQDHIEALAALQGDVGRLIPTQPWSAA